MVAKLKGFSLAYLHVIHFEPSRFNMKIFARVLFFSSEVFPSILQITQNTYRGQWAEPEGPGKDKSYQYLLGNLQNGERVKG